MAYPDFPPPAKGASPPDSVIHICINRMSHLSLGYQFENRKLFEGDRLIWAIDLHFLAHSFTGADWETIQRIAIKCGAATCVASGLEFARAALGITLPEGLCDRLRSGDEASDLIHRYFAASTGFERLKMDFSAAPGGGEKFAVLKRHLLPGREFMSERYPDAGNWPLPILHLRRLLDAGIRMLMGAKR